MASNAHAIKKPTLEEEQATSHAGQTTTEQPQTHMTQVFLIPQITQCNNLSNVQTTKVIRSSISDSGDSTNMQSMYLGTETESSDDDKSKSNTEPNVSKPHPQLSSTKIQYGKRRFSSLSSQGSVPIGKDLCSLLSDKESGNESGYSSQSASYLKCQPVGKGAESLLDGSVPLVDIENLDTKPNGTSEESGSISCNKKMRFLRTATALQRSGLMEITIKTADILKQNRIVNREIERLREDTLKFLQSVIRNPENKLYQETLTKNSSNDS